MAEEEEVFVYLDLQQAGDATIDLSQLRILGLETDRPVFVFKDMMFEGTLQDTVGTNIFFETTLTENGDTASYRAHTSKRFACTRLYGTPKVAPEPPQDEGQSAMVSGPDPGADGEAYGPSAAP
eukprot:m.252372 g.252372  ORF g.252372 m.252372 type:complete len:124 (+) comp17740_c0_seq1:2-373(+)